MTRFSRRSLVPSVPINWNVLKKTAGNPLSSTLSKNKIRLSLMIFTVILIRLKKFCGEEAWQTVGGKGADI
ncbi:hypothetical protein AB1K18_23900 [Peribacillus simplex]|uniref:hypothetical protein n=1 Tax=Peribacillus simplex TaxID=1478 RepID=UPI003B8B3C75